MTSDSSPLSPEPVTIMYPSLITLLGFGLWLSQWITAHATLPRPTLQADPGPLIPWKKSVTLQCQGSPGAEVYYLKKDGSSQYRKVSTAGTKAEFPISSVVPNTTGSYRCLYKSKSQWSKASEHLKLVMTGWYDKPRLSALPSTEVFLGENVTLRCQSQQWFKKYVLYKEAEASLSQNGGSWYHSDFHIPEVTDAHRGSYRCYSFHEDVPYAWSEPSDPLELRIRGATDDPQLQTSSKPGGLPDSVANTSPENYTTRNLIRLVLAGLVLIILGGLLVEALHSQKEHQEIAPTPGKEQGKVGIH